MAVRQKTYDDASASGIERYGQRLINQTLRKVSGVKAIPSKYLSVKQGSQSKGAFGGLLEKYYYGITPPNDSSPDFPRAGVELKSTPIRKLKKGIFSAKERLVLGLINYHEESKKNFASSTFLKKNRDIMLVAYLHDTEKAVVDYLVKIAELISFTKLPKEDQLIIRQDWNKIINKIKAGHADELSEGDTLYLGACTKAATSANFRTAPGNIEAKPRAFAFKQGFMTTLMRGLMDANAEPIVKDVAKLEKMDFEKLVEKKFEPFLGLSAIDIKDQVGEKLNPKSKNFLALLARRMMGVTKTKIEEFEKAGVMMKVMRIGKNQMPREDISFPYFKYMDIIDESWDESPIKEHFEKKFFFVVFQCGKDPKDIRTTWLKKVMFWNMPANDLEEVKKVWQETIRRIKAGRANALPKLTENRVSHVRPHGRDGDDKIPTPRNGMQVKKAFWFNKGYIREQIGNP